MEIVDYGTYVNEAWASVHNVYAQTNAGAFVS